MRLLLLILLLAPACVHEATVQPNWALRCNDGFSTLVDRCETRDGYLYGYRGKMRGRVLLDPTKACWCERRLR